MSENGIIGVASRRRFMTLGGAVGAAVVLPAGLQSAVAHAEQGGWLRPAAAAMLPGSTATRIANVLDYGAVGDGYADDTAAFATAIASLPEGGTVLVPVGMFAVSQIRLRRRINLVGQGWRSIVVQRANSTGGLVVLDDPNVEFTRISSLMLNGNKAAQTAANHGIDFDNEGGTFSFYDACHAVDNVLVFGAKGHGIRVSQSSREIRVSDVYVTGSDASAFGLECTDGYFVNCAAAGSGLTGWDINGPNNKFSNCKAFGNGRLSNTANCAGFMIRQSRQMFTNCEAQDNAGSGFFVNRMSDVTLSACVADSNGFLSPNFHGFEIKDSNQISLLGYQSLNRPGKLYQQYGLAVTDASTAVAAIGTSHDNVRGDFSGTVRGRYITINSQQLRYTVLSPPTDGIGVLGEVVYSANPGPTTPIAWICVAGGTPGTWSALGTSDGLTSIVLPPSNGRDDTAVLNAALRAHAGQQVVGLPGSTYILSSALIIATGTVLDMSTCTVSLKPGSHSSLITNEAADTISRSFADAAITAGDRVLNSASAAFSQADIGRSVVVGRAAGSDGPLCAVITAVTSPTAATLSVPAGAAVTDATATLYDRDANITIRGGVWDRAANNNGSGRKLHSIAIRRCDGVRIHGLTVTTASGQYAVNLGDVTEALVANVVMRSSAGGLHINGPASSVAINQVTGTTGGDLVSVTARDYAAYNDVQGYVTAVRMDGVSGSTPGTLVKLIGGVGASLGSVAVRNLAGSAARAIAVIDDQVGATAVDDLSIDGVAVTLTSPVTSTAIDLTATAGGTVSVRRITFSATAMSFGVLLGNWSQANISDVVTTVTTPVPVVLMRVAGVVGRIKAMGIRVAFGETSSSALIDVTGTGDVGSLTLDDVTQTLGRCVLSMVGRLPTISITRTRLAGAARFANIGSSTDLSLTDVVLTSTIAPAIYVYNTAEVLIRGADIRRDTSMTGVQKQGTQVVRSTNLEFPINVALLTLRLGDRAFNTNSALPCGVGPVLCDGSHWRNLYSGETY